jgi:hypothetical protein
LARNILVDLVAADEREVRIKGLCQARSKWSDKWTRGIYSLLNVPGKDFFGLSDLPHFDLYGARQDDFVA